MRDSKLYLKDILDEYDLDVLLDVTMLDRGF